MLQDPKEMEGQKRGKEPEQGEALGEEGVSYKRALIGKEEMMSSEESPQVGSGEEFDGQEEEGEQEEDEDDPNATNPCRDVRVAKEEHSHWSDLWKNSLIVHLLGRRVSYGYLESRLQKWWERDGKIRVVDITNDHCIVQFTEEADYKFAFQEGPWIIAGHYLIVQRWSIGKN